MNFRRRRQGLGIPSELLFGGGRRRSPEDQRRGACFCRLGRTGGRGGRAPAPAKRSGANFPERLRAGRLRNFGTAD